MGEFREKLKRKLRGVILFFIAIGLFLSILSFHINELSFLYYPPQTKSTNYLGIVGNWLGFISFFSLGWAIYGIIFLIFLDVFLLFKKDSELKKRRFFWGKVSFILSLSLLLSLFEIPTSNWGRIFESYRYSGGIIGYSLWRSLFPYLGRIGTPMIGFLFLIIGIFLFFPFEEMNFSFPKISFRHPPSIKKISRKREYPEKKEEIKVITKIPEEEGTEEIALPPLSLLNDPPPKEKENDAYIAENAKRLEKVLEEFGLKGEVVEIHRGPVITSYEVKPGTGIKVHQITALQDDVALALKARSLRIVSPIPGKAALGIEIPNPTPRFVYLKEIISSEEFMNSPSKLSLALGKDIRGNPVIGNLKEMPHLLIAGTTGSGKTVCLHSLIMSILFHAFPGEVKFLLIDPKMVELAPFSELPHLYSPIIIGGKQAAKTLQWIVEEMEARYRSLAEAGVRDIEKYNKKSEEKIPYIVVVIDELADLMAVASRQVEDSIMRLAQLSRAAGIHLILATQRPSVDVITGVIKANFPCRLSFQVSSKIDSRTILDMSGAEKLLGKGDMLYLPAGFTKPIRVQGSLVTEEEIRRVVNYWMRLGKAEFEKLPEEEIKKEEEELPAENDPLFKEAVRIILITHQASASNLQRRMRIGYARAGRLIDLMEKRGIVGQARGSKPREILVSDSYLEELEKEENNRRA